MFNKLLICLCLADLLFLVSNLAVSPVALQVAGQQKWFLTLSESSVEKEIIYGLECHRKHTVIHFNSVNI